MKIHSSSGVLDLILLDEYYPQFKVIMDMSVLIVCWGCLIRVRTIEN